MTRDLTGPNATLSPPVDFPVEAVYHYLPQYFLAEARRASPAAWASITDGIEHCL
jgi:hypothetical protein